MRNNDISSRSLSHHSSASMFLITLMAISIAIRAFTSKLKNHRSRARADSHPSDHKRANPPPNTLSLSYRSAQTPNTYHNGRAGWRVCGHKSHKTVHHSSWGRVWAGLDSMCAPRATPPPAPKQHNTQTPFTHITHLFIGVAAAAAASLLWEHITR